MDNVFNFALVQYLFDRLVAINYSGFVCHFDDVATLVSQATGIDDIIVCRNLARCAIVMLENSHLLVYTCNEGYKVLPAL